jgi:hypothetical protein
MNAKERPILFSGPMVLAILEGRKTMTRRVRKPQPKLFDTTARMVIGCPYGQPGDRLYVKETFLPWDASGGVEKYLYRATEHGTAYDGSWKSPLFMPRKASRITLEITGVRVERVQEITWEDAKAEGITYDGFPDSACEFYRQEFKILWDSINAKRGFGWDVNPWVWVIEFKQI